MNSAFEYMLQKFIFMILSQMCSKGKLPWNNHNSQCTVSDSKQPIQETISKHSSFIQVNIFKY